MRTAETKVYPYAELSDDAKEKAIEHLSSINVEHDWWDGDAYPAYEIMRKCGIETDSRGLSFDLDRSDYIYFHSFRYEKNGVKGEHKGIWIEDHIKLARTLQRAGLVSAELVDAVERGDASFGIEVNHYGGGSGSNSLSVNADGDAYEIVEAVDQDGLTDWLRGMLDDLKSELRSDYEYLTSREAIEETIEANDYEFTEAGKVWR